MPKTTKTLEERIEEEKQKLEKMKKQLAVQKAKETAAKRKADAHNKIILGGVVLKVLGRDYEPGDENRLIAFLEKQNERGNYFNSAMYVDKKDESTEMEKKDDAELNSYSENSNFKTKNLADALLQNPLNQNSNSSNIDFV